MNWGYYMNKISFLDLLEKIKLKIKVVLTKSINDPKIRKKQKHLLEQTYDEKTDKLIIFLTSGYDMVNGGILSISSIYEETKKLVEVHGSQTILCTTPGEPLILKYTKFENQNYIFNFSDVLSYFNNLKSLTLHIPEYACKLFLNNLSRNDNLILNQIEDLKINLLIQNIEVATDNLKAINKVKKRFKNVTGTTAHENYSNHAIRKKLGIPLHKLSTYVSPEIYEYKNYKEKKDLMIVSHDKHTRKSEVLKSIKRKLPYLKIEIIKDMTYNEYKNIISEAKWALTFGEGLDGYFIEPIFSGAISYSVYNPKFFTKDFKYLETVYLDYDQLIQKLPRDLEKLDNENSYVIYQQKQYNLCSKYYDYEEYLNNLKLFYQGDYTFK